MQPDCYICTCTKSNGRGLEALERGCVTLKDNVMFLDVLVLLFVMPSLSLHVGRGGSQGPGLCIFQYRKAMGGSRKRVCDTQIIP